MNEPLNIEETSGDRLVWKMTQTLEEAQIKAQQEAANVMGTTIPVMIFRQGKRTHLTGAVPMGFIADKILVQGAEKRSRLADAKSALNRPEDPSHTAVIAKYLFDNYREKYILPPLTLNLRQRVSLYVPDYNAEIKPGYLVVPRTAALAVTDGQHRTKAIIDLLSKLDTENAESFAADAVAMMITCESDLSQIHQDFADCSRTKPLPPSQVAVFDQRNPANRLLLQIEDRCRLFKGRIDPTSKSLSKNSIFLFLANQLRQMVKELVCGSFAMPDADFEKRANQQLGTEAKMEAALNKYAEFVNYLTERIPVWNDISKLAPDTLHTSQIPLKRQEGWICLTVTGLNVIGRIGHQLFTTPDLDGEWTKYADRLAQLDWSRSAEIWQGNIVQNGKIRTQNSPVKEAIEAVRQAIDLPKHQPAAERSTSSATIEVVESENGAA
jgi:DNA sulfur modification protein DndB